MMCIHMSLSWGDENDVEGGNLHPFLYHIFPWPPRPLSWSFRAADQPLGETVRVQESWSDSEGHLLMPLCYLELLLSCPLLVNLYD